jgi:excisionase family DNA binding protein
MIERATMTLAQGAEYLGISKRSLWQMLVPRGPVPCLKLGRKLFLRKADLDAFLERSVQRPLEAAGAAEDSPRSDMEAQHGQKKSPSCHGR